MTQEPTSRPKEDQPGKSSSSRRSRANRNRPVLVTSTPDTFDTGDQAVENGDVGNQLIAANETDTLNQTPEAPATDSLRSRRLPKFFSTVGKTEQKQTEQPAIDPAQARIARATGGKTKTQTRESKQQVDTTPAKNTPARTAPARSAPPRPAGAFKMRYIVGMLAYLLIADLIGTFETSYLTANHLNYTLFSIGSFPVTLSTVLFLLTLIVVLIVLARFDLIPRNLAGLGGQQPARKTGQSTRTTSEPGSARTQPPTMKQGVKGADDDLYQEYREQQRYNQRRERKK